MAKILLLNGPNLNLLGQREPGHYGTLTLESIENNLQHLAKQKNYQLDCFQSNAEYALIDRIHTAQLEEVDFILFNPAAFTHTSIALRDALLATKLPFIEIHLSNVYKREAFRHHSYFSDIAEGCIIGLGPKGYELALEAAIEKLKS
ncbi:MAG: type II 3-dehydroquinate dehydratase [Aquificaceae bacterium]|nr:MAG: type II 3-dehydroquinate dehydratase [Aquificaceae bacterium]